MARTITSKDGHPRPPTASELEDSLAHEIFHVTGAAKDLLDHIAKEANHADHPIVRSAITAHFNQQSEILVAMIDCLNVHTKLLGVERKGGRLEFRRSGADDDGA
jgi:hypothetical protein